MKTIQILESDHRLIEQALQVLGLLTEQLQRRPQSAVADIETLLEFFRVFADGLHHSLEEKILFPAMAEAGIAVSGGPIGSMLTEHEGGREQVACMIESLNGLRSGDPLEIGVFTMHSLAFTNILSHHIQHEDSFIYPLGQRRLSKAAKQQIDQLTAERESRQEHERVRLQWTDWLKKHPS